MDTLKGLYDKAKSAIAGPAEAVAAPVEKAIPSGTDLGMSSEPAGMTSGGGRKRKTRSASKRKGGRRHRKTARKH